MGGFYENKLAFTTGGSEGIGWAVAKDLAGAGAHVVICSRNQEKYQNWHGLFDLLRGRIYYIRRNL